MESVRRFEHHAEGIDWYCEQRGEGPPIVLVPSGEGDCASFEQVAAQLANQFTVLTFDMPGFSRSRVHGVVMSVYAGLATRLLRLLGDRQQMLLNRFFSGLFATAAVVLALVRRGATA